MNVSIYIKSSFRGNPRGAGEAAAANACRLGWLDKWQQDGWKKANGKPPANVEEWKQFYMLMQIHTVTFEKYNDRYDTELEKIIGGENEVHGIESEDHKVHSADYSTKN